MAYVAEHWDVDMSADALELTIARNAPIAAEMGQDSTFFSQKSYNY